jgi:hypothetical protein
MIQVVGGCYNETCLSPDVRQFYGSGGRAAAALASRLPDVVLHTYGAPEAGQKLKRLAELSKFKMRVMAASDDISFGYFHPLQSTKIVPPPQSIRRAEPFTVNGDVVLYFGMLEGVPAVDGQTVVYDPQNGISPIGFKSTGSHARRLAIVCNKGESLRLTGLADPQGAAKSLLASEGADVVVIKGAAQGALVASSDGRINNVPAYRSKTVFGIGSGDIFAAAFTFFWAQEGRAPEQAADLASRAVSHYVETREEKLASDDVLKAPFEPAIVKPGRVYLAGPFFSMAQIWLVEEARMALRNFGLNVFSPLHDVGYGAANDVAPADLAGLETCDRVFAILDGLDAGTVFEVGFARKIGLPVIAYAETISKEACTMFSGSGCRLVDDFATAVYETAWVS